MTCAWLLAGVLAAPAAQGPEPLFTVREEAGAVLVTANRAAVPCDLALEELGGAVGWKVRFAGSELRARLSDHLVDLSIEDRSGRTVASLLATVGGADVVFVDRSEDRTELMVVDVPDATTKAGRERLREWALEWYGECLSDRVRPTDDTGEDALRVRMHIASLLHRQGRLRDAAAVLEEVYALAPFHPYVPMVLLRMAECWFELGPETWVDAERRARDLVRLHSGTPEAAAGTVLLGRILLAQGRAAECAAMLERAFLRLADQPEIVDVYLLLGTARYRMGDPAAVQKALATLEGGHDVSRLDVAQQLDRLFLTGYVHLEAGRPRASARAFEQWFAVASDDDPRRGAAFVLLGRAYYDDMRFLQARAAAIAARRCRGSLDRDLARQAAELHAVTALALGDEERVIAELELEARQEPEGEVDLTMMVADLLLERRRYARCIDLLERVGDGAGEAGDAARLVQIEALFAQAEDGASTEEALRRAVPLATRIRDEERQRRAAELVGRAYEAVGDFERAADAYRGVLR